MTALLRPDGRPADELRPVKIRRRFTRAAPGSVLISAGRTMVLCTASITAGVPAFLKETGRGWLTAEYAMLPGSTAPRKPRGPDGRSTEIQRLIGRSLRAVVDLAGLGERTLHVDCDVLEADGGTRTLAITGAFVAVVDGLRTLGRQAGQPVEVLRDSVAAVSVGIRDGRVILDLDYAEDASAEVDLNLVMTGSGRLIEVQGTGERTPFSRAQLEEMLRLGGAGIGRLTAAQRQVLGPAWPRLDEPGPNR